MSNFKVREEELTVLNITVIEGRGISVGWFSDSVDTPDPYVKLRVAASPNVMQRTRCIPDEVNPKWNSEFKFFLNPDSSKERKLEIIVMDEDFGFDDTIGTQTYDIDQLKLGEPVYHTFKFKEKTFVDVKLLLQIDVSKQLRYGHNLCDDEKSFFKDRTKNTLKGMEKLLTKEKAPKNIDEAPVIAVIGSGGGFRAMCGLSGVFAALEETGVLDCTTYVSGLSGSSWYLSTLYSNHGWPGIGCEGVADEMKDRIDTSFIQLLTPLNLAKYIRYIRKKKSLGYPVSFVDFFGCLVGETLLKDRTLKLSAVKEKVVRGKAPLPLLTAVHVQKDVSAQVFSEWVEFSPFEVGIYKYGVFAKTEQFGGKFFKGRLIRNTKEQPLHYLQGMWGSAFTILFQRLLNENGETQESSGQKDEGRDELKNFVSSGEIKHINEDEDSDDEVETDDEDEDDDDDETDADKGATERSLGSILASPFVWLYRAVKREPPEKKPRKAVNHKTNEKDHSFWTGWLENIVNSSSVLSSREGRAAEVHNLFRGLKLESVDANGHSTIVSNNVKNSFMVDGGLDFNSPYPLILRPERNVDFIISFDFSQRDSDDTPPFSELLLAEEWAREHNYPFPPIATDPRIKDRDVKELYVFEDVYNNPDCPIVMHFVLINKTFKNFKEPGVPRETKEEKSFADFSVFDDDKQPYSSFKFDYSHKNYDRLYKLMKFNTLLHIDAIKTKMAERVQTRRNNPNR